MYSVVTTDDHTVAKLKFAKKINLDVLTQKRATQETSEVKGVLINSVWGSFRDGHTHKTATFENCTVWLYDILVPNQMEPQAPGRDSAESQPLDCQGISKYLTILLIFANEKDNALNSALIWNIIFTLGGLHM